MRSTPRAFGSRTRSYLSLVGVVTSLLAGGLAIPFVFGEPAAPLAVDTRPDTHYDASADPERASEESSTTTSVSVPAASDDTLAPGPTASGEREGPTDTSSGAAVPLGATDRGVSATTIRVGVLVPDAGAAANLGLSVEGADPETIEGQYRAFFDATNAQTINGRTVEPVFRRFNPLDQGSRQAACIALTEDTEVFAILNHATFFGDPVLCVTEQHQTPLILGSGASPSLYQRSGGLLVTAGMADARSLGGVAAMLDGAGDLSGRTIGVVHPAGAEASASFESFRAELERRGYQVAHDEALGEPATAQGQIPLAVSRMRAAGVDLLLLSHNPLITTSFVQQAASQGYQPRYVAADNALNTTDEATQNMPDAYDGAIGITAAHQRAPSRAPRAGRRRSLCRPLRRGNRAASRAGEYPVRRHPGDLQHHRLVRGDRHAGRPAAHPSTWFAGAVPQGGAHRPRVLRLELLVARPARRGRHLATARLDRRLPLLAPDRPVRGGAMTTGTGTGVGLVESLLSRVARRAHWSIGQSYTATIGVAIAAGLLAAVLPVLDGAPGAVAIASVPPTTGQPTNRPASPPTTLAAPPITRRSTTTAPRRSRPTPDRDHVHGDRGRTAGIGRRSHRAGT